MLAVAGEKRGLLSLPFLEHLRAFLLCDVGLEDHAVLLVDLLQLLELFPYVNCETSRDSGTKRGSFAHSGAVDWDTDDVRLCLSRKLATRLSLNVMS